MTAPNIVDTQDSQDELMDPMERTIQSTLRDSAESIAADVPITDRPRDATGKFVARAEGVETEVAPGEWNTIPDAPLTADADPATPPAPVIPEGHVALPALAPEKVQGFKVMDTEGEIIPRTSALS